MEVAITLCPIGEPIPADWRHLHVVSQQVVAGMRTVLTYAFEEYLCVESFSDQPPHMVCEGDDHGPNLVTFNQVSQVFDTQHPGQPGLGFA
jgi:hypothetical protein